MTFEEWLQAELPRLLRFADVLCGGPDPAEEVVQDVAIKVHARWSKISRLEFPQAYVRRMIVNEYLSWRRKWSRMIPQAEFTEHGAAGQAGFAEQHADRAELTMELAKLPRRQRAVLVLRYFEGLSDADIATVLGCSSATVRSHVSRGLSALRIEMSPAAGHVPLAELSNDFEEGSHAH